MRSVFKSSINNNGKDAKIITENEAKELIDCAVEADNIKSGSCHSSKKKGTSALKHYRKKYDKQISAKSKDMIDSFLATGRKPKATVTSGSTARPIMSNRPVTNLVGTSNVTNVVLDRPMVNTVVSGSGRPQATVLMPNNGNVTMPVITAPMRPSNLVPPTMGGINSGSPVVSGGNTLPSTPVRPTMPITPTRPTMPSGGVNPPTMPVTVQPGTTVGGTTTPTMPNSGVTTPVTGGNNSGGVTNPSNPGGVTTTNPVLSPGESQYLKFDCNKNTWSCHWFPIQATETPDDTVNNLYAKGGTLDKFDMLTGANSRAYELANNHKARNAGDEFHWWGHCNFAAEAACVLREPKHGVVMTTEDGKEVRFTKTDIQGLLVKTVSNLIDRVDFKGQRFNRASRDNPNDPLPDLFLDVMKEWKNEGIPFVMDIDPKEQVWNFPYDKVDIKERSMPPLGFDSSRLANNGKVSYYHIEMSGTGYPKQARVYECYIQRDESGKIVDQGWIKTNRSDNNPDFMWRPHLRGDFMDQNAWVARGKGNNPEVEKYIKTVYEIYMKSLA